MEMDAVLLAKLRADTYVQVGVIIQKTYALGSAETERLLAKLAMMEILFQEMVVQVYAQLKQDGIAKVARQLANQFALKSVEMD